MKISLLIVFFLWGTASAFCQDEVGGGRSREEMSSDRASANDISSKTNISPVKLPSWDQTIQVNESGDGEINIPVITIQGRKLNYPIGATYITSGIKMEQQSSEIGLGWNMTLGSIRRDYGAYEPDYTSQCKETEMKDIYGGGTFYNNKIKIGYLGQYNNLVAPIDAHSRNLEYDNVNSSYTPDLYHVNINGNKSNSFWNSVKSNTTPDFKLSEYTPWKINYDSKTFEFSQELSRINEYSYKELGTSLDNDFNKAAAIGFYPYVEDQAASTTIQTAQGMGGGSPAWPADFTSFFEILGLSLTGKQQYEEYHRYINSKIKYKDYSNFKITKDDGTSYIFGRALRSQKYMFNEDPFWTTRTFPMSDAPAYSFKGEFWKTDFIQEWLITEIHSADYTDANGNGIADDGDFGDWIRFDYSYEFKYETAPGATRSQRFPTHSEWLNFTQTDQASSLRKERAYLSGIETPLYNYHVYYSEKFDIDFDYSQHPMNRAAANTTSPKFAYGINKVMSGTTPLTAKISPCLPNSTACSTVSNISWEELPASYRIRDTRINYHNELMKYDSIVVLRKIDGGVERVRSIEFKYATKGSPQELCVSQYSFINNDKTFVDMGATESHINIDDIEDFRKINSGTDYKGRGRLTLLGIKYYGKQKANDEFGYGFGYDYNPNFDEYQKYRMYKQIKFPTLRESRCNSTPLFGAERIVNGKLIQDNVSPWYWLEIPQSGSGRIGGQNWGENNKSLVDVLGYNFNSTQPLDGRHAWALTGITLPWGGTIDMEYERDSTDVKTDKNYWMSQGSSETVIPAVAHYNTVAETRSYLQRALNNDLPSSIPDDHKKHMYRTYSYIMPFETGGLRIKRITIQDPFNNSTPIIKKYRYGLGHFNTPPVEYWNGYLSGYSSFMQHEYYRHRANEHYTTRPNGTPYGDEFNDFSHSMLRLMTFNRIDKSIDQSKHFYEYIDEIVEGKGKVRRFYGRLLLNELNCVDLDGTYTFDNTNNQATLNQSGGSTRTTAPSTKKWFCINAFLPIRTGIIKGPAADRMNMVELITTDVDNSKQIGNYRSEYYKENGSLEKVDQIQYDFSQLDENTVSLKEKSLFSMEYQLWTPNKILGSNIFGLSEINNLEPYEYFFRQFITNAPGVTIGTLVDILTDPSLGPLSSLIYDVKYRGIGGLFEYIAHTGSQATFPLWTKYLTLAEAPWSANSVNSAINDHVNLLSSYYHSYRYKDAVLHVDPFSYRSHQSYKLKVKSTTTTNHY